MTNASAQAPRRTPPSDGTQSTTTCGSSALPSLSRSPRRSLLRRSRVAAAPQGGRLVGPVLTAATSTTTQRIAPLILFVLLASLPPLLAPPLAQPQLPLPPPQPQPQLHNPYPPATSPSPTSAAISTGAHASAAHAAFAIAAQSAPAQPMGRGTVPLPIDQQQLVTPIRPLQLERELAQHPDQGFVRQLLHNIRHGCRIGYDGPHFAHTAHHLPTAYTHTDIITTSLAKECQAGRMAGPYLHPPLPNLRCSGLGVVPKKDGGWRIIYHLYHLIDPTRFSLHYCTVDAAIRIVNSLGPGTLMAKLDLKNAFRLLPVHKDDWHLLGIHWKDCWYIDKCLPFGLRSSPALFNMLADALQWIMQHNYQVSHVIHYLDDYFTAGPPNSNTCQRNLAAMTQACSASNVPIKLEKTEGPATTLTFLGIQLNSLTMSASITADRKEEILSAILEVYPKRTCTKRQLLSLIGKLSFACKVVPPGRIFLRRLIDLSTTVGPIHHHVTLNSEARADLNWWREFLPDWSGTSLFLESEWSQAPDMELYTDASNIGYGAYWPGRWFNASWSPAELTHSIARREMYAILVACATWGKHWQRKKILFHCDNAAVVQIWQRGSCKCQDLMVLVRTLFFLAAKGEYHVSIAHIPGVQNCIADHLSRLSMQAFWLAAPLANPQPCSISTPAQLTPL